MPDHNADMQPVLSSHILAVGHDPEHGLIVEFVDGGVAAYRGASQDIAAEIAKSPSPGAALHTLVKQQGYQHTYLTAPMRAPRRRKR